MNDNALKTQAFTLKGRLYTLTVLSLKNNSTSGLESYLSEVASKAPNLFNHTPVVLDCSNIEGNQVNLTEVCQVVRKNGLVPVAVQGGSPMLETLAQCQGLAVLNASSSHDKPIMTEEAKPAQTQSREIQNKLITSPVRSGQQVVCKGDLVITTSVSHGAELLADGNIHVYGPLRGRALAGISGNKSARIFCHSLEAELVAIAGFYRLSDALLGHSGPCQIFLKGDQIHIESI